jgi:hypothetical protein
MQISWSKGHKFRLNPDTEHDVTTALDHLVHDLAMQIHADLTPEFAALEELDPERISDSMLPRIALGVEAHKSAADFFARLMDKQKERANLSILLDPILRLLLEIQRDLANFDEKSN